MSGEDLKGCPFCGGHLIQNVQVSGTYMHHPENPCILRKYVFLKSPAMFALWNTRPADGIERAIGVVEEVKDADGTGAIGVIACDKILNRLRALPTQPQPDVSALVEIEQQFAFEPRVMTVRETAIRKIVQRALASYKDKP